LALFVNLEDNVFLPLTRGNKHINERCLSAVYERFYKDAPRFPRRNEVIAEIYETLKAWPELWNEEAAGEDIPELLVRGRRRLKAARRGGDTPEITDVVRKRALKLYDDYVNAGWFEEERFGVQITVDMTPGALALMESLFRIRDGFALQFSGTLVILNQTLDGLAQNPYRNALGLETVRRELERFMRHLRAIISDLKRIKQEMTEGETQSERIRVFLEGFVRKVLLKDFAALHTSNHPYRYKNETLHKVSRLASSHEALREIGRSYAEHHEPDAMRDDGAFLLEREAAIENGVRRAEADFAAIENILGHIDEMFARINVFQRHLEERLRNMLRYRGRGKREMSRRADDAMNRLIGLLGRQPDLDARVEAGLADGIEGYLQGDLRVFGPAVHANPQRDRQPMKASAAVVKVADPVDIYAQMLKNEWLRRLMPSEARIGAFLEKVVNGPEVFASCIPIETIDEFLCFDAVLCWARRGAVPDALADRFEVRTLPGSPRMENEYVICEDFRVLRKYSEGSCNAA